jgi:hypothetical protein
MVKSALYLACAGAAFLTALPVTGAQAVTLTFTGVAGSPTGVGYPWGYDAFGANIVGDTWSSTLNFNLSNGVTQIIGSEQIFTAGPGGYSGAFTINGHTYDATGSYLAEYIRTSDSIELVIYDEPSAFDGLVIYAPLTNTMTISPDLGAAVSLTTLAAADMAASGEDVVLPLGPGALFATLSVSTLAVAAPEPSTWAMMVAGFAGLGLAGYRGSRKSAPAPAA